MHKKPIRNQQRGANEGGGTSTNLKRVDRAFVGRDNVFVIGELERSDAAGFDPVREGTWADSARFSLLDLLPHSSSIFVLPPSLSLPKAANEFRSWEVRKRFWASVIFLLRNVSGSRAGRRWRRRRKRRRRRNWFQESQFVVFLYLGRKLSAQLGPLSCWEILYFWLGLHAIQFSWSGSPNPLSERFFRSFLISAFHGALIASTLVWVWVCVCLGRRRIRRIITIK